MYLIVIAWMYVVLMMAVAEATSTTGTVLGALITLLLYGVGPVCLVVYLLGAPRRSKAIKQREAMARAASQQAAPVVVPTSEIATDAGTEAAAATTDAAAALINPDAGSHPPSGAKAVAADASAGIPPVREK